MERLYYSITEVAQEIGVEQSVLRYWEQEFTQFTPKRNAKGTRFYTPADLEMAKQIAFLRYTKKLTIDGTRQQLNTHKDETARMQTLADSLRHLRAEVDGLLDAL